MILNREVSWSQLERFHCKLTDFQPFNPPERECNCYLLYSVPSNLADTACDVKPNPAYDGERHTLHPAKDSSSSMNVTNPIYETAKTSEEEGDYVDMEAIDTEEEPQAQHKYEYVSAV